MDFTFFRPRTGSTVSAIYLKPTQEYCHIIQMGYIGLSFSHKQSLLEKGHLLIYKF